MKRLLEKYLNAEEMEQLSPIMNDPDIVPILNKIEELQERKRIADRFYIEAVGFFERDKYACHLNNLEVEVKMKVVNIQQALSLRKEIERLANRTPEEIEVERAKTSRNFWLTCLGIGTICVLLLLIGLTINF